MFVQSLRKPHFQKLPYHKQFNITKFFKTSLHSLKWGYLTPSVRIRCITLLSTGMTNDACSVSSRSECAMLYGLVTTSLYSPGWTHVTNLKQSRETCSLFQEKLTLESLLVNLTISSSSVIKENKKIKVTCIAFI